MKLNSQEKDLLCLYYSGSRIETAFEMRDALPYINEPQERIVTLNLIDKLETMSDKQFNALARELEAFS